MAKKKKKGEGDYRSYFKHRKPIPRPGTSFRDKSKYTRKKKHKNED